MNIAPIIKTNEEMNCTLISTFLNTLPLGESPKLPFSTSAGEKDVI